MTFTSGWASAEHSEEDAKANLLPFDSVLHRKGWFDNHRAAGPATREEDYYRGPKDNLMYTDNRTENLYTGRRRRSFNPSPHCRNCQRNRTDRNQGVGRIILEESV